MSHIYDTPDFYQQSLDYIANANKDASPDSDCGMFACPFCGGVGKAKWGESLSAAECELAHGPMTSEVPLKERLFQMARYWYLKRVENDKD